VHLVTTGLAASRDAAVLMMLPVTTCLDHVPVRPVGWDATALNVRSLSIFSELNVLIVVVVVRWRYGLCRDYNCDSTAIRLRSDYDVSRAPASIRRQQEMNMSVFRRSRIVVISQSNRNCDIGFSGNVIGRINEVTLR